MTGIRATPTSGLLVVVGDLVQDTVVWLEEPLQIGSDTKGEVHNTRGGSAANVACAAASLIPTRFIGCVGVDILGDLLEEAVSTAGVDVRLQRRGSTGVVVVLIDQAGERTMVPSRAASSLLRDVDDAWLDGVSALHITAYSLEGGTTAAEVVRLAERTHKRGGSVSIDTSSSAMLDKYGSERFFEVMEIVRPEILFANDQEWRLLDLDRAVAHRPPGLDGTTLVRKAGSNPTLVYGDDGSVVSVPVPHVEKVTDTTGAGDAFAAGFLARSIAGASWVECCETGHEVAATVLGQPGAGQILPSA